MILLPELERDLVGNFERVLEHVRAIGESRRHFGRALEVQSAIVAHPIGVAPILAESDAQQHVVRVVILAAQKVRVVRGNHGEPELASQREHPSVQRRLPLGIVRLHFEVVAILEDLGVPGGRFTGAGVVPGHQMLRDLTGQAGRRHDDPFAELREQFPVDARLGVESFRVRERRQLDQVAIPYRIARQQDEVVVRLGAWRRPRTRSPITRRNVCLHADDRFDSSLLRPLLEVPGRVQIPVVGNSQRRLLELLRASDEVADPVRAVEERILRVAMEMDEGHLDEDSG